jgi:RNA ligase (TIGR02306 family)
MSTFEAKIVVVDSILPHTNADKLEIIPVGGYNVVVGKGIHTVGDEVVYVLNESVFTDLSIAAAVGVDKYLVGADKNRVKAIRLRGVLSQGIILPKTAVADFIPEDRWVVGADVADCLKLEKYEEPIPIQMAGEARPWPSFLFKYDVENLFRPESLDTFNATFKEYNRIVATEKLHGTNVTFAVGPELEDGETGYVCSRNYALKESDSNLYWRVAKQLNIHEKLRQMMEFANARDGNITSIAIIGEIIGTQDLKYGLPAGVVGFYAFDLYVNGVPVAYDLFNLIIHNLEISSVPEVYDAGFISIEHLQSLAQGNTLILPQQQIKEGIVIRNPKDPYFKFKIISDEYLVRENGTEMH